MSERILIVSDTHRYLSNYASVIELEGKLDRVIHLGDMGGEEETIESLAGCNVDYVIGNNDWRFFEDKEKYLVINGYSMFLTHGHCYDINAGYEKLLRKGLEMKADAVLFGHTHMPYLKREGSIMLVNPGSIALPRQPGRQPSYIILEIDDDGKADFSLRYLGK